MVVQHEAHRRANPRVALLVDHRQHELAELGHLHFEPQFLGAGEARRSVVDDLVACILEPLRRGNERRCNARVKPCAGEIVGGGYNGHALGKWRSFERCRRPPWIARVACGHRGEAEFCIGGRPRQRSLNRHDLRRQ